MPGTLSVQFTSFLRFRRSRLHGTLFLKPGELLKANKAEKLPFLRFSLNFQLNNN